jgi:hypothetical protein
MLAYQLAIAKPDRNDPNWPLPSFDARDWAKSFVEIATKNGHGSLDEGWMISWFANALMRGYDEHAMRVGKESPSPAAIAAFMDTVRRLNNSVDFGEVEPAAGVWRWLEELAGGTLSVKAEVSEFDRGMMLVRHAVERLIDTDHAIGVDDRGIIDNILAMLAVGPTR